MQGGRSEIIKAALKVKCQYAWHLLLNLAHSLTLDEHRTKPVAIKSR